MKNLRSDYRRATTAKKRGGKTVAVDPAVAANANPNGKQPRKRREPIKMLDVHEAQAAGGANPADLAARAEELRILRRAIEVFKEVNPRDAEVLTLLLFGGLTPDEVAERFDVAPRTVRRILQAARQYLADKLGGDERQPDRRDA